MWRKEDGNPQTSPEVVSGSTNSTTAAKGVAGVSSKAAACVSQGIKIKGEVTGSEDLFVDGSIDGKITLSNATVTVGPNAVVRAEIGAREVVVRGRAEGKFTATERIQIWNTARVQGDLKADRIAIEEGAEVHGKMEAGRATSAMTDTAAPAKKSEAPKPKDVVSSDEKAASGATAGAD